VSEVVYPDWHLSDKEWALILMDDDQYDAYLEEEKGKVLNGE